MENPKRFNLDLDAFGAVAGRDYRDDGEYMDADKVQARIAELEKTSAIGVLQEQLRHADEMLTAQGEQIDKLLAEVIELQKQVAEQNGIISADVQMYNAERELREKAQAAMKNLQRQREIDEAYTMEVDNSMSELQEEHDSEVSALKARIKELEDAQQWKPIEVDRPSQHETVFCGCQPGCTDQINIWNTNLIQVINPELKRSADIVLPEDIHMCRKVQP